VFDEWKAEHSDLESIKDMLNDLGKWETTITKYIRPQESRGLILVQGRKLAARLSQRVKEEQGRMKEYLLRLAEGKARGILNDLVDIKTTLNKPPAALASYVEYVSKLEQCQRRKDELADQKKKLEEMK
jgi:hypothetical protein